MRLLDDSLQHFPSVALIVRRPNGVPWKAGEFPSGAYGVELEET